MYTELLLKCEIKEDTPPVEMAVIKYLLGDSDGLGKPDELPDHHFFNKEKWDFIGNSCSYYHTPIVVNEINKTYVFMRCDLKNYGGEIEAFLDWIWKYIDEPEGQCIGWFWYEENDRPDLLILTDTGWTFA